MVVLLMNFLKTHWVGAALVSAATGVIMVMAVQRLEIAHLHNRVREYEALNATLIGANHQLELSALHQDAAIAALKADSDQRAKLSERLLSEARTANRRYAARIRQIRLETDTKSGCKDVMALVQRYIVPAQ